MSRRLTVIGRLAACLLLVASAGPSAMAQTSAPVRMKLEGLTLRTRSGGPIPVQIKLEYNNPQILEGDLILELHDAINVVGREDLLATMRFEDLVLAGTDYIFNAVLPPLTVSGQKNLAVVGWFETEDQTWSLSSSLEITSPPEPFDLLMVGPTERGVLLCSCSGRSDFRTPSSRRQLLNQALSLDQFNPLGPPNATSDRGPGRLRLNDSARRVLYHATSWPGRDLPEDPLSLCCFDMVLLADGALGSLTRPQLDGLKQWIAAGGRLCVCPDEPLRPLHLAFLQSLLENNTEDANLALGDDGLLLLIADGNPAFIAADHELGRVALIRPDEPLTDLLQPETVRRLNVFLWHARPDSGILQTGTWNDQGLVQLLRRQGIEAEPDGPGWYRLKNHNLWGGRLAAGESQRVSGEQLRDHFHIRDRFAPSSCPLVDSAQWLLLPRDVEIVPAWVISVILLGYVLTVGPIDYLVLGWLRMRKYTWIVFPVVTGGFTVMTIAIAHDYMGSEDTGGAVTITDVSADGTPLRSSTLQMLFYGSRTTHVEDGRFELLVPAGTGLSLRANNYRYNAPAVSTEPLSYSGHFPRSWQAQLTVQQWTPALLRSFAIAPDDVSVLPLDWSDPELVTSHDGRRELARRIEESVPSGADCQAVVIHGEEFHWLVGDSRWQNLDSVRNATNQQSTRHFNHMYGHLTDRASLLPDILMSTSASGRMDYFGVVSQVAPQGSGTLEDLVIHEPADLSQWILVVIVQRDNRYEVYRRKYSVPDTRSAAATTAASPRVSARG